MAVDRLEDLDLVDKLSQVLLLYALDHEVQAAAPLTMAANLLRVVDGDGGSTILDALARSGISREAMAYLTGWRQTTRFTVEVESRRLRLTPAGIRARDWVCTGSSTGVWCWCGRCPDRSRSRPSTRSPPADTGVRVRASGRHPLANRCDFLLLWRSSGAGPNRRSHLSV